MKHVLYNNFSGDGRGEEIAKGLSRIYGEEMTVVNMVELESLADYAAELGEGDDLVICGGDGTLNRFVNEVDTDNIKARIFYFPAGTGNDFATDIGIHGTTEPVDITKYTRNLPTVTVNGKSYKYINGVGFGIDGYCAAVGDDIKASGKVPNYTSIAIKGMLFAYKPTNATVIVDGVEHSFKKAWLAPAMFGRHYGGGMIAAPCQKRDSGEISVMLFSGKGRLATLIAFPSIFKGEHVKNKMVTVMSGKEITVKFDRPTPLQIDGETILGVTEYTAFAPAKVEENV